MRHRVEVGQARHQHHRGLADAEEQPFGGGIGDAPARPSRQVDRYMLAILQSKKLQRRRFSVDADAGCNSKTGSGDDHGTIRAPASLVRGARFQVRASSRAMLALPRLVTSICPSSATAPAAPGNPGNVAMCLPASWSITSMVSRAVCAMKTRRLFASKAA